MAEERLNFSSHVYWIAAWRDGSLQMLPVVLIADAIFNDFWYPALKLFVWAHAHRGVFISFLLQREYFTLEVKCSFGNFSNFMCFNWLWGVMHLVFGPLSLIDTCEMLRGPHTLSYMFSWRRGLLNDALCEKMLSDLLHGWRDSLRQPYLKKPFKWKGIDWFQRPLEWHALMVYKSMFWHTGV